MAAFVEGPADRNFIPIVARRTAEIILNQKSLNVVDVLEPQIVDKRGPTQRDKILNAALDVSGFHLLIVHADADSRTQEDAWAHRIEPGLSKVRQAFQSGQEVCSQLVPVIPIRMTEAWMLADPDSFIQVIGTAASQSEMGMPKRALQVESLPNPKSELQSIMDKALNDRPRRRRRKRSITELFEPLARIIRLDRLAQVPAYEKFQRELELTLRELSFF